jgi:hypothetical protein
MAGSSQNAANVGRFCFLCPCIVKRIRAFQTLRQLIGAGGASSPLAWMGSNMSRRKSRNTTPRPVIDRLMDVRMISVTCGCAIIANMLIPSMGSTAVGAVLGAAYAFHVLKSRDL